MTAHLPQPIVDFCRRLAIPAARFSLFLIYFWFGILKLFDASPANPLVSQLLERTMPFITFDQFIIFFGWFEMLIGVLFLFRRLDKLSATLFVIHMITTVMPLVLLPAMAWQAPFVPSLAGQYMIKNLALIALVISIIASHNYSSSSGKLVFKQ